MCILKFSKRAILQLTLKYCKLGREQFGTSIIIFLRMVMVVIGSHELRV